MKEIQIEDFNSSVVNIVSIRSYYFYYDKGN